MVLLVLILSTGSAYAEEIQLYVNETMVVSDVPAQVINNRTLLPVRSLLNSLGVPNENITYNSKNREVICIIEKNPKYANEAGQKRLLRIKIGDYKIDLSFEDGKERSEIIDVPATIIEGRVFLPVRGICNALQINDDAIFWNANKKIIYIVPQIAWELSSNNNSESLNKLGVDIQKLEYVKWQMQMITDMTAILDRFDEDISEAQFKAEIQNSVEPAYRIYQAAAEYCPPDAFVETHSNYVLLHYRYQYLCYAMMAYGIKAEDFTKMRKGIEYKNKASEVNKNYNDLNLYSV